MEITPESFTRGWRVGVLGAFLCSQAVIPDMLKKAGRLHSFYRRDFLGSWSRHHFQQRKIRAAGGLHKL